MLFNVYDSPSAVANSSVAATTTSLSVGTTSSVVFAADPNRVEWTIYNSNSNSSNLCLGFGANAIAANNAPIVIRPGQAWKEWSTGARAEVRGLTNGASAQNYASATIVII